MILHTMYEQDLFNPLLLINNKREQNDICICEDTGNIFIYNDTWIPYTPKIEGEGFQMSLYDLNKQSVKTMSSYDEDRLNDLSDIIRSFYYNSNNSFYMLLNHELHYFTLFKGDFPGQEFSNLGDAVVTVIQEANLEIVAHELYDNKIEIWGRLDDDVFVFILFPYDAGVVSFDA